MFKSDIFAIGLVSLAPGADSLATADNDFPIAIPTFSSPLLGLRLLMTILPMIGLVLALVLFTRKFILTDEKAEQIRKQLEEKKV